MVATVGYESNIFPTNATIAALAVFQLGLLILVTPAAERLAAPAGRLEAGSGPQRGRVDHLPLAHDRVPGGPVGL